MCETTQRSMLFGPMLVEWECDKCRWIDYIDIDEGTDYDELESIVCAQHNQVKPQCEYEPHKVWLTFRPAEV